MAVKYTIAIVVAIIVTVFYGLGTGLEFLKIDSTSVTKASFFESCTTTASGVKTCEKASSTCEKLQQGLDAGKAFGILSTILAGFWLIVCVVRFVKPLVYLAIGALKIVNYVLIISSLVSGVLLWIIGFALYGAEFCGTKLMDTNNAEVGSAAPIAFVGSCLVLVQLILECVMEDDSPAEAASSEANAPTSSE